ncbi:electron transfer flavoprotein subunit alpha/FixB family protein [bacterium]|nr:electron transfer flavoprotein subunit alpha/FixB family protein [bacterium]
MGRILIIAEQFRGQLRSSAGELASAAAQIGGEFDAAVFGPGAADAAQQLGAYGPGRVLAVDCGCEHSGDGFAAAVSDTVASGGYEFVILMQTAFGRDLGARLAARLDAAWINDVIGLEGSGSEIVAKKPLYAGKVISHVKFNTSGLKVLSLRPRNFDAVAAGDGSAAVEQLGSGTECKARCTALEPKEAGYIDLKDADIIVSGGRGIGNAEGYSVIRDFANEVGAAMGASRAIVDAGWIDHSYQVGQTGKVVNPQLYIAAGISGAIQHLAGMQTSKVIVAINNTESAPIFKVADYGIVGDMFEVLPELAKQIKAARQ